MTVTGQAARERALNQATVAPGGARGVGGAGWHLVRSHWIFGLLLAGGLALRLLAEVAYRPALLYIDSAKYLEGPGGTAPQGYRALLRLLDPVGGFALVAGVQHLFGLGMAVALYAVLRRRAAFYHGAPRWVAALATAPVLLDAYQLQLESTIMPDVLFETLIAAGLVLLLWRPTPSARLVAAGALVLGVAATVREIGAVLVVPVVVFAATSTSAAAAAGAGARAGWRRRAGHGVRAALAAGCFALPALGYGAGMFVAGGHFGLGSNGPGPEYGRAAAAADCTTLVVPADERALCPSPAQTLALGGIDGLLHSPAAPSHTVPVPPGVTRGQLLDRFSLAVVRQQPVRVAWSVARDSVRLFALTRDGNPQVTPITRWQFQTSYPVYPRRYSLAFFARLAQQNNSGGDLVAVRPAADILRSYQLGGGFTPGPLYAAFLALGVLGALSGRRRRDRTGPAATGLAGACALVTLAAVVLLVSSDAFEFSWRYQLPAVVMLPLAGALGLTALVSRRPPAARQEQTMPLRGTLRLTK
ncbi:MAG TPA: hypothetical protein VFV73_43115 [Streptosporangiaceae bacterium]|nr:hypothetical protein [Streptosporangiaceae bacterium]